MGMKNLIGKVLEDIREDRLRVICTLLYPLFKLIILNTRPWIGQHGLLADSRAVELEQILFNQMLLSKIENCNIIVTATERLGDNLNNIRTMGNFERCILGDINLTYIDGTNTAIKQTQSLVATHGLNQIIKEPTRVNQKHVL